MHQSKVTEKKFRQQW